jgi:hypothetical protein
MAGTFVLIGYLDQDAYDTRTSSWEPETEYADVDAATAAAQEWIVNQSSHDGDQPDAAQGARSIMPPAAPSCVSEGEVRCRRVARCAGVRGRRG